MRTTGRRAPRFSVLMPTHNRADVVGYAIQSVLWQTEQDFELLIVGDGCTDNTAEVVGRFTDPRIRWFDLEKAPYFGYANRNIALRQARGEFIALAQDDDIFFDDHLALLAATLDDTGKEWAYSLPLWVDVNGTVVAYPMNLANSSELDVFLTRRNSIPSSCVVHRRACFEQYGYWPEDVPSAADWRFWVRIIEGGGRANFAYCREPTCLHFVANWRREKARVFDGERWPMVTSQKILPGATEQEVYFDAITAHGGEWVSALREKVRRAVDRFAWRAMTELVPQIAELKSKERESRRSAETALRSLEKANEAAPRLARAKKKEKHLLRQIEVIHKSRSWRVTSPLRAISRMLFR